MLAKTVCGALGAAIIAVATTALAHSTLETSQASPNSTYKGVLRVPHGCKGEATKAVRIQIPETIIDVRPMPKAGWTLTTPRGAYAKSYDLYGKPVADGVKEIVWSGGELPDAFYDEFVFRARITAEAAGTTLAFPVVQERQNGSERWVEIAADGQDPHTLKAPAPTLKVAGTAAAAGPTYQVGALVVEAPWSRATPGGAKVAGGYMRITNAGPEADRLVGGSLPGAARFEVHEMSMQGEVMRMRPLETGLEIKPGATIELKPGGYHIMFMDLREPLKEGQTLKGTLLFEKAGAVAVEYAVRGMAARGAAEHRHAH
jgi:periplasmic copper chaperone A